MNDINGPAVRACVDGLGSSFVTKDVSEDDEVKRRHGSFATNSHYHATVGRWLSENAPSLDIVKTGVNTRRGMRWEKLGSDTTYRTGAQSAGAPHEDSGPLPLSADAASTADAADQMAEPDRYGPQYAGDSSFAARMRFHQSWWRADVLEVPFGTGPSETSPNSYGNMLEADAAAAGRNFLSSAIHQTAVQRIAAGGGVEEFRCTRNLLSSQPMCFNLFAELGFMDPVLATACTAQMLPDPSDCVAFRSVTIEFAPSPRGAFLDDRTAFDAFIDYERADGSIGFIAVETKLTEPFSQKIVNVDKYLGFINGFADNTWLTDAESLIDVAWFQLLRNHLLAKRLLVHAAHSYTAGVVAVVHHPLDTACLPAIAGYQALLTDPDRDVLSLDLATIVERWTPVLAGSSDARWLSDFDRRYVDLTGSEAAWRSRKG